MDCPLCKDTNLGRLTLVRNADVLLDISKTGAVIYPTEIGLADINFFDESELVCTGCGASSKNNDELAKIYKGLR